MMMVVVVVMVMMMVVVVMAEVVETTAVAFVAGPSATVSVRRAAVVVSTGKEPCRKESEQVPKGKGDQQVSIV